MSSNIHINQVDLTAPTPQNTPLTHAPIAQGLSRPTVPDITEDNEPEEELPEGGSAIQQAMLGLVQGKLAGLLGKSSGYIESLPVEVKRSVEALKGVQVKQVELQNQYKRECLELERKYLELQKPLYDRRHAIITGTAKPTPEEIAAGEAQSQKDDPEYSPLPADPTNTSAIPEFWLTALRNHIGLAEIITDRDAAALKHLTDIRVSYLPTTDAKPGFKLRFFFSPNEFFENEMLEKTYLYQEEVGYSGDFMYDRAIGTEIKWKEDKDLTKEFEIKKQRNKNTNRTRLVRKARPTESFFNFFSPPVPPSDEAIEAGDIDEDELEEIEEKLEIDYQIGEDIKEKIIPRAVDYFTGKALEFEDIDEDDDDFEDIESDDDDDEDRFEEDDSDSDADVPARRRGPPKGRGGAAANNVNPEECKQQ
ncbi:NAP-domain-containing protein [Obba rivulosa]|uniref:NAP-domain-containing protein n=1 Tax=Obba rivulosa TaxID=1052685 RepID=A0A8E2AT67_9APHY|nr:NAP-domain-containing protein [Obba rivulosa]